MAKIAQFYSEAERMYVHEGYSIDAIVALFKNQVSRKTVYNWKAEGNWDAKRTASIETTGSIREELIEIARLAIKEAKANPGSHQIFAVVKAVQALKTWHDAENTVPDEKEKTAGGITPDLIREIEEQILGVKRAK
jgi:hypothetical protein